MKSAIITGPTGAIGTALIDRLIHAGIKVLALIRPDSPRASLIPEHPLVSVRECALDSLKDLIPDEGERYDAFFHLGWQGTSGTGRNDMYLQTDNIRYTLDATACAARFGCEVFVGAGSQAEYGPCDMDLRPDTPEHPGTGYGYAKLCAGRMSRSLAEDLGIRHIWVRILSIYGPNDNPSSLISAVLKGAADGTGIETTPAEQKWDYLYSGDAAEALIAAADRGCDGAVYVLGSGTARPLKDYLYDIESVYGRDIGIKTGARPYGPGQVMYLRADISAISSDTGWKPRTGFTDGIRQCIEAYKE